jgi:Flp pilus assembly pilin Flp
MNEMMFKIYATVHSLMHREEGQDLVEYSLTFTMIALGCVSSMGYLASGIGNVFSAVGQTLTTSIT